MKIWSNAALLGHALALVACSGLKLDKDSNCLNASSGCFKPDKTAPKVISYVTEPPPDANNKISSLSYVDVIFSEEPKGADIGANYKFDNNNQGDLIVTSVLRLSDYKYRIYAAGQVGNGPFTLNYSKLTDYADNPMNTLAMPVALDGSSSFVISANIDHLGVSSAGYTTITLSFSHNYTADITNNNSYEVRITSGAAQCVGTDPQPSVGTPNGTFLAAGSPVTFTNIPRLDFPAQQNRIVVCVKNQVNPSATAIWSTPIYHFNGPITTSYSPAADAYQNQQSLNVACTGYNSKIAYTSASLQGSAPANPPTPTFDSIGNVSTGNPYAGAITLANIGDPTYWKVSFRCIDIAGNQSPLTSNLAFTIDSTLPGVTLSSNANFRSFVSNTSGFGSTTLDFTSDQANHQYRIASGITLCSPAGGGASLIGVGPFSTNATPNGPNTPYVIAASTFAVGSNEVRICVQGTVASVWGTAYLQITRDDTAPTIAPNVPTGVYGALQGLTFNCSDTNPDKVAYTYTTQVGAVAPTAPADPTFNATTGDITNGTQQTGPFSPPDQSATVVKFQCIDKAGNQSAVQSAQYTIDATLPLVNFVSQNQIAVSSAPGAFATADIVWNSSRAGLTYYVRRVANCNHAGDPGNSVLTGTTPAVGTNITSTLTTAMLPTNNTQYPIRLCVFNYSNQSTYQSASVTVTRDNTAPVIAAPDVTPSIASVNATTFTLSWNAATDTGGSGVAFYRIYRSLTSGTYSGYPNSPDYTATSSPANIAMPDTQKYYLRIQPVDAAGNPAAGGTPYYNEIATRTLFNVTVAGKTASTNPFLVQLGTDTLSFTNNGTQTFPSILTAGASYSVTITGQPENQQCAFIQNQYGAANGDITLNVTCVAGYMSAGSLTARPAVPLYYHLYRCNATIVAGSGGGDPQNRNRVG
ncbi:MAG: hypothetical protein J0L53_03310 [Spirochaetes bacterium]|nr:hypothetical protein [Spirochaetota bacterium]